MSTVLPVDEVIPQLAAALRHGNNAVLQAPPGAGKTTRIPLALLNEPWLNGKRILMLEPRRLAARSAAHYMARQLDEPVGETVGYRVRMDSRVGKRTRIEVLTEGVLTRLLQDDPSLTDVGLVIFDEFHERSLQADLGLALCLEIQAALRDDLRLLVMSATLAGEAVSALLGNAPVITSTGRSFPVATRYLPPDPRRATGPAFMPSGDSSIMSPPPSSAPLQKSPAASWCSCPGLRRSSASSDCCVSHKPERRLESARCTANSARTRRTKPSSPRPRASAKWCWPPPSPRPASPSRASAWSSTAAGRAGRASIRSAA